MSLAIVSLLGDTRSGQRYMDWLMELASNGDAPLNVVYRVDGGDDLHEHARDDLAGYRGSRPVRSGNRAFRQRQLDSLGFLAECALVYLDHGGEWRDQHWTMIRRAADYTSAHWRLPDSGIWELPHQDHYVSSKVMSWVTLKRAVQIAGRIGRRGETDGWRATMEQIQAEVMQRGWSDRLQAFRQRYDVDTLDAATLLIPVMGFLPADHPRVVATVAQIEATLTIDGFVHRFVARDTPGHPDLAVGAFEGAFLPCTFWLATTYAKQGRTADAEAILERAEAIAGALGLFAEEVDVETRTFRGNSPLLWAQMEYVQAIVELAKAQPIDTARYLVGAARIQLMRRLPRWRSGDPGDETTR
jgi:GH15 family glucan-1,4-alpha-glucosidase